MLNKGPGEKDIVPESTSLLSFDKDGTGTPMWVRRVALAAASLLALRLRAA